MKINKKYIDKRSVSSKRAFVFAVATVLMIVYLGWRLFFTLPLEEGPVQVIFGILLFAAEAITTFTTFELYYRKLKDESGKLMMPVIAEEDYPDIDVFIATHNEPEDILFKTASACTFMKYPDKNKVHIYICDDGNRAEIKNLADRLGVGYIGLAGNKLAKSGNLNHAMECTSSPLIATFDADMIPVSSFLMNTVPYFLLTEYIKDEETGAWRRRRDEERDEKLKIGLIQTPQSFYNLDLFQFNLYGENKIPNEQDFFSREVNLMRNSSNACAYTGSNTVLSREAMDEIGGFPYHTITEDFETSCRLQMAGYITYATEIVGAHGLSTTDVPAMMRQRVRWARGVIQSIKNTGAVWSPKLPVSARITYMNAFLYWWSFFNRLIFILAPIMFALFDFKVVNCNLWELLIFWLPSYFFYSQSMKFLSSNIRNQKWSQIIDTTFAPVLIIPVFLETIGISEKKFKVTRKEKTTDSTAGIRYIWPHLILTVMSVLAIIRYTKGKYGMALIYSAIIIYWLCYNLITLLYAIAFVTGRKMVRRTDRIPVNAKARLTSDGRDFECETENLSDEGALFVFEDKEKEVMIPELFTAEVEVDGYKAKLDCKIVGKWQKDNKEFFSANIRPVGLEDHRQYVQILYDRDPGIVKKMDMWNTTYDDLLRIVKIWLHGLFSKFKGAKR